MWTADKNNFQPRFGFTYRINEPMVLRGGIGLFVAPFQVTGVPGLSNPINQFGYSRNTLFPVTADNGLTFQANLTNPLPSGQLLQPVGSSLGLSRQSRRQSRHGLPRRARESAVLALQHRPRAPVAGRPCSSRSRTSARRARTCRSSSRSTTCPQAYRTQSVDSRHRGRDVPHGDGGESLPGTVPRQPRRQRRDDRAAPAAPAAPAVRHAQRGDATRDRTRTTGSSSAPTSASQDGFMMMTLVHLLAHAGEGGAAQSVGTARGSDRDRRSPAPRDARHRRRTAVRPRQAVGHRLEQGARCGHSAAGSSRPATRCSPDSR